MSEGKAETEEVRVQEEVSFRTPLKVIKTLSKEQLDALRENNIKTVEAFIYRGPDEIQDILPDLPESKIMNAMIEALTLKKMWMVPASEWRKVEEKQLVFTTGSKALDHILGGGVHSMYVAEFYGEFGVGKTQILYTLMVEALNKWKDRTAVYIDCEDTYSERRVREIVEAKGYAPEILDRIILIKARHTMDLIEVVKRMYLTVETRNVVFIACDSLISHLRAEYHGREMLYERQHALIRILSRLKNLAVLYNIGVAVSNQVVSRPVQTFTAFGDMAATGGHIMGHNTEPRVHIIKGSSPSVRVARIEDSCWLPPAQATFLITKKGVTDVEQQQ